MERVDRQVELFESIQMGNLKKSGFTSLNLAPSTFFLLLKTWKGLIIH